MSGTFAARATNDENGRMPPPGKAPPIAAPRESSNRRVLGNVSPNVPKHASPAINALRGAAAKPMAGSPLKRSFTAAMESQDGFTYLKKRKLSADEYLSDRDAAASVGATTGQSQRGDGQFKPLLPLNPDVPEIHEPSPTEPNTPTSDGEENNTQGSSQDRKSFSSLINYDPSSQTSHLVLKPASTAEMLRLRLRVAMYKVRTNQTEVPFQDLEVGAGLRDASQEAVEEAVAQLRREAMEVQARDEARREQQRQERRQAGEEDEEEALPIPKLSAAPVLLPTAYSSRMIYDDNAAYPSSPPNSKSPERLPGERLAMTTPRHRRIPNLGPDSAEKCDGSCEQELTSSVVKGRVAEGLLGLRHAV